MPVLKIGCVESVDSTLCWTRNVLKYSVMNTIFGYGQAFCKGTVRGTIQQDDQTVSVTYPHTFAQSPSRYSARNVVTNSNNPT